MNTLDFSNIKLEAGNNAEKYLTAPVYTGKLTAELSNDLILPDYIADAKKIVGVFADIREAESGIADGKLRCTGEVAYTALLLTEEDAYKSVNLTVPFDKSTEIAECAEPTSIVFPALSGIQGRLLSPRKLNLRSRADCDARVYGRFPVEPDISGAKSAEDEFEIERDIMSVETMSLSGHRAERESFSEDIEVDNSLPAVSDILYCAANIYTVELRPSQDRVQISAEAEVSAIYTDDGGALCPLVKRVPIAFAVDNIDAGGAELIPLITVTDVRYSVENNGYGERRIIELDFGAEVELIRAENKSVEVMRDCYSTASECKTAAREAELYTMRRALNTSFSFDARISRSELALPENPRPVYTYADMRIQESSCDAQRGRATIAGEADIHMLITGDGGTVEAVYSSPFKYEADCGELTGEFGCMAAIKAVNARGRMDGGGVYCDLEAVVTMAVTNKSSETVIGEIKLGESRERRTRPSVLLYYPSNGERLWDIAKRYGTTRQAVSAANNIVGDRINGERVIMIPRKPEKEKEAVYAKII